MHPSVQNQPESYHGKRIAVLGAGESGEAAAVLLLEEGAMVTLLDSADLKKLRSKIQKITPLGIALLAGDEADRDPNAYDRGNISPGFAAVVRKCPELDVMTLEVSSFQLETIRTFRPHIAAWLNFSPNHLDRYKSVEDYR